MAISTNRISRFSKEFLIFGLKEARASIFAGSFFVILFASNHIPLFGFARYDFLFVAAVIIQLVMYFTKLETKDEVKVICLFHVIGLGLELFKTSPGVGSWSYPEEGFFKIATVPLYSGFMYAAVGSYISQAWKGLRVRLSGFSAKLPEKTFYILCAVLCVLIYLNFFTNHYIVDVRWFLMAAVFALFWKVRLHFTVLKDGPERWMPLNIAMGLVAFFIWVAENISTYLGAWQYPDQVHIWTVVSTNKVTSWFLMVIISFILVAGLKWWKGRRSMRMPI